MASVSGSVKRLMKDYKAVRDEPIKGVSVYYDDSCVHKCYFMMYDIGAPYTDGEFIAELAFPSNFPFAPPVLKFYTPNGRFQENKTICMSFTHYHSETWNPLWTVRTLINAIVSCMHDDTSKNDAQGIGHLNTSAKVKTNYSRNSKEFNNKHYPELTATLRSLIP